MYRIFDKALREKGFNLYSEFHDDAKIYNVKENVDGNLINVFIVVEKSNIYHQVFARIVENIPYNKEKDFLKLANDINFDYKNLCCTISEDNHFSVSRSYVATEDSFDSEAFFMVISGMLEILKERIVPEALRLKYR